MRKTTDSLYSIAVTTTENILTLHVTFVYPSADEAEDAAEELGKEMSEADADQFSKIWTSPLTVIYDLVYPNG